mgnify:CR=1 FL=1
MSVTINREETATLTKEQEDLFNRLGDCYFDACDLGLRHTADLISDAENMVFRELRTRLQNLEEAEKSVVVLSKQLSSAKEALKEIRKVKPVVRQGEVK